MRPFLWGVVSHKPPKKTTETVISGSNYMCSKSLLKRGSFCLPLCSLWDVVCYICWMVLLWWTLDHPGWSEWSEASQKNINRISTHNTKEHNVANRERICPICHKNCYWQYGAKLVSICSGLRIIFSSVTIQLKQKIFHTIWKITFHS